MTNIELNRYSLTAERIASEVIKSYSTSFGWATRLLGKRHRQHIKNIYAMVRIADEIADGVAAQAGLSVTAQATALDEYESALHKALDTSYSTDLILHAFAGTAKSAGIDKEMVAPFFASMRADIKNSQSSQLYSEPTSVPVAVTFTAQDHATYVYGSAQVVGLMCLQVFLRNEKCTDLEHDALTAGAKSLGAAFQNINFLRDLSYDLGILGRSYLTDSGKFSDTDLENWITIIRQDLDVARSTIPMLPSDARCAVRAAHLLFATLTNKVARTPLPDLLQRRVRINNFVKAIILARAILITTWERVFPVKHDQIQPNPEFVSTREARQA